MTDASDRPLAERLFREYGGRVVALFRRDSRARADAADLAQEVFRRLLDAPDGEVIRDPAAYLFTIAHNLRRERAVAARRQAAALALGQDVSDDGCDPVPSPEQALDLERRRRRLPHVLAQLPPKCRAAIVLQYRDGLTYEQIGERLGVSANMVKKYLGHGLAHCRRRMATLG